MPAASRRLAKYSTVDARGHPTPPKSRLPPRLPTQLRRADHDRVRQRLAHVVDGERGDGGAGQRFHLHAGAMRGRAPCIRCAASRVAASRSRCGSHRSAADGRTGSVRGVRLTAIVPAMIAVSTIAALRAAQPAGAQLRGDVGGKAHAAFGASPRARSTALAETSTIAGRPAGSRWVRRLRLRFAISAADQVHLDVPARRRRARRAFRCSGPRAATTASRDAVEPARPRPARSAARRSWPVAGEQAGVQLAVGRHARAVAIAAERRADRTDEADFAARRRRSA